MCSCILRCYLSSTQCSFSSYLMFSKRKITATTSSDDVYLTFQLTSEAKLINHQCVSQLVSIRKMNCKLMISRTVNAHKLSHRLQFIVCSFIHRNAHAISLKSQRFLLWFIEIRAINPQLLLFKASPSTLSTSRNISMRLLYVLPKWRNKSL